MINSIINTTIISIINKCVYMYICTHIISLSLSIYIYIYNTNNNYTYIYIYI